MTPPAPLQAGVRRITLFREFTEAGVIRREPPRGFVTLIVSLADPIGITTTDQKEKTAKAMAVSPEAGPVIAACGRETAGIEIEMRPWLASGLLRQTKCEGVNGLFDVTAILPAGLPGRRHDTLSNLGDHAERIIDRVLHWVSLMPRASKPEIVSAWAMLERSRGCVPVSRLARHLGWSHRHFADLFEKETGQKPKQAARLLRFGAACDLLEGDHLSSLAEIAFSSGYSDQSHMTREFICFAATTPAALRARKMDHLPGFAEVSTQGP